MSLTSQKLRSSNPICQPPYSRSRVIWNLERKRAWILIKLRSLVALMSPKFKQLLYNLLRILSLQLQLVVEETTLQIVVEISRWIGLPCKIIRKRDQPFSKRQNLTFHWIRLVRYLINHMKSNQFKHEALWTSGWAHLENLLGSCPKISRSTLFQMAPHLIRKF
jgi:hypothetical protein